MISLVGGGERPKFSQNTLVVFYENTLVVFYEHDHHELSCFRNLDERYSYVQSRIGAGLLVSWGEPWFSRNFSSRKRMRIESK